MSIVLLYIDEKLKRADQHVRELRTEIDAFLNETPQRELPNYDVESADAFKELHAKRLIRPRIGVLTGEVFYQLRSCLDHLLCALIIEDKGTPGNASQFPIFAYQPKTQDDIARYQGQIAGITCPIVIASLQDLQPWKARNPKTHWLSIFKIYSNFDKHQSLLPHLIVVEPRISHRSIWQDRNFEGFGDSFDDGTELPAGTHYFLGQTVEIMDVQKRLSTHIGILWPGAPRNTLEVCHALESLVTAVRMLVDDMSCFIS